VAKEAGRVQYGYRAPRHGLGPDAAAEGEADAPTKVWQLVMAVGPKDFEAARVGAPVTVLYDPHKPSRSVIYPFAEYEAVEPPAAANGG
jgi:hypothetical protein